MPMVANVSPRPQVFLLGTSQFEFPSMGYYNDTAGELAVIVDTGALTEVASTWPDTTTNAQEATKRVLYASEQPRDTIESWVGAGTGDAYADPVGLTAYQATALADNYGAALQVLGAEDTPVIEGRAYFDVARILIVDHSIATAYRVRFTWGATLAAGLAADQYSEIMFIGASGMPMEVGMPKLAAGTSVWVQIANATGGATADFFLGLNEYDA